MTVPQTTFDARRFLPSVPQCPGVYRMLDADGKILYVGKARNLRKRLASYFRKTGLAPKTAAMVSHIAGVEFTVTHSEAEALLLEQNLIKAHRPPYNILLRDDKSYPYIYLSAHQDYPSLTFRRVRQRKQGKGQYFGPYTSAGAVRDTLVFLQKVFRIRQCDDSFYAHRNRPCLQHQIGRCSAPCVQRISPENYRADMQHAILFLQGNKPELIQTLISEMESASSSLAFERAASLRDQVNYLRRIQEQQSIEGIDRNIDVFALARSGEVVLIHGLMIRDGAIRGTRSFLLRDTLEGSNDAIMQTFLEQYYFAGHAVHGLPDEILLSERLQDADGLQALMADQLKRRPRIATQVRGDRAAWLKLAATNAAQGIETHLQTDERQQNRWKALMNDLDLPGAAQRIECFDISHTQGESTVGSCVVFGPAGARKDLYRRFNVRGITGGDDYAAMTQVLTRHYTRIRDSEAGMPDVVLVDGGAGQLSAAEAVFDALALPRALLLGVAKGVTRKAGWETLIRGGSREILELSPHAGSMHLIQQIRDEAHRFAITGHRKQRARTRSRSVLEDLPGIGPRRRRDLLNYFGSLQNLERASVDEIGRVPGLSTVMAEKVYAALHA